MGNFKTSLTALCVMLVSPLTQPLAAQNQGEAGTRYPVSMTQSDAQAQAMADAVQRHVDAYRSGDLERFVATFTHDAVVDSDGMVSTGHAEIRAAYAMGFQLGFPQIFITESGVVGDRVYLMIGYVFPDGEEICCTRSEYWVRDGKISYVLNNT